MVTGSIIVNDDLTIDITDWCDTDLIGVTIDILIRDLIVDDAWWRDHYGDDQFEIDIDTVTVVSGIGIDTWRYWNSDDWLKEGRPLAIDDQYSTVMW